MMQKVLDPVLGPLLTRIRAALEAALGDRVREQAEQALYRARGILEAVARDIPELPPID